MYKNLIDHSKSDKLIFKSYFFFTNKKLRSHSIIKSEKSGVAVFKGLDLVRCWRCDSNQLASDSSVRQFSFVSQALLKKSLRVKVLATLRYCGVHILILGHKTHKAGYHRVQLDYC